MSRFYYLFAYKLYTVTLQLPLWPLKKKSSVLVINRACCPRHPATKQSFVSSLLGISALGELPLEGHVPVLAESAVTRCDGGNVSLGNFARALPGSTPW